MYQGFYNLASGMLTQSRNLNTISNNMVNIQTPGYKNETMVSSTFKEEMLYRTGQYSKENPTQLATVSKIKTAKQVYTNYDQAVWNRQMVSMTCLKWKWLFLHPDITGHPVYKEWFIFSRLKMDIWF